MTANAAGYTRPDWTEFAALKKVTQREREIAELIAQEQTNLQIAKHFDCSERTIDAHVRSLLGKLGADSRTGIAMLVVSSRVTTVDEPMQLRPVALEDAS